ncbi:hypothetical protein IWW55_002390 [Coemansia sp. RSA 2706]|nr:hypothetical protein IWW55_002390 [Coemansia sp. RSA 2706]
MLLSVESIIHQIIADLSDELRRLSLEIHDHPETALNEKRACQTLTAYLDDKGYRVERAAGGLDTAFVATCISPAGSDGLNVGFCSEYDALPALGHACGHNLIAISGVAMFVALARVMETCRIPGTVRLFGTPAEEALGGKIMLQKQGVFDDMDLIMMVHPSPGYSGFWHSQACLSMAIEYFGKSAHAAMAPWEGINAGTAATVALQTLGALREQLKPDWRTHGIITDGGRAANVIPDYSRIEYTIRTGRGDELDTLRARVLRVFEAAALATGCTHRVREEFAYLDNQPNPVLAQMFEDIMGDKYQTPPLRGAGGSTDFGNLSQKWITLHGMYDLAGTGVPNHSKDFARDARTQAAHDRTLFAAETVSRIAAHDATRDLDTYPQLYAAFEGTPGAPELAFDTVLRPIEDKWLRSTKPGKKHPASPLSPSFADQPTPSGISGAAAEIRPSIALLMVLNVLVMSFPRQMSEVLSKKSNASRLLMFANFKKLPVDLRMVLVTMVGRWCVVLACCPAAERFLASIVDSVFYNTGNWPRHDFATRLPREIRLQDGWIYPRMKLVAGSKLDFYIPAEALSRDAPAASARPSQPSQPAGLRQPQELLALNEVESGSESENAANASMLDLGRMKICAQELHTLSSMFVENLSLMSLGDDPRTNTVIQDMIQQINQAHGAVLNHSRILDAEYAAVSRKLQTAADEAKQSLGAYSNSVSIHQDQHNARFELAPAPKAFGSSGSPELSLGLAPGHAESSKNALARNVHIPSNAQNSRQASASSTASGAAQPTGLARVSTKVRGKMTDTSGYN